MIGFEKYYRDLVQSNRMKPKPESFDKIMAALEKKKKRRGGFILFFFGISIPILFGFYQFIPKNTIIFSQDKKDTLKGISIVKQTKNRSKRNDSIYLKNHKPTYVINDKLNETKPMNQNTSTENKTYNNNNINQTKTMISKNESMLNDLDSNNRTLNKTITHISTSSLQNKDESKVELLKITHLKPFMIKSKTDFLSSKLISLNDLKINKPNSLATKKFSVGLYSDLGVSKNLYTPNISGSETVSNLRNNSDIYLFNYSLGAKFKYNPIPWLGLESGIAYHNFESSQYIDGVTISSLNFIDSFSFANLSSSSTGQRINNKYDFISIPLHLYFQTNPINAFGFEAGVGVLFDIPVSTNSFEIKDFTSDQFLLENKVNNSQLNMFGVSLSTQLNFVYHFRRIAFYGGPYFRYRVNSLYRNEYYFNQNTFFIGAEIGVRYNF